MAGVAAAMNLASAAALTSHLPPTRASSRWTRRPSGVRTPWRCQRQRVEGATLLPRYAPVAFAFYLSNSPTKQRAAYSRSARHGILLDLPNLA